MLPEAIRALKRLRGMYRDGLQNSASEFPDRKLQTYYIKTQLQKHCHDIFKR